MAIELASDLDGYIVINLFFDNIDLEKFIEINSMVDDPCELFYKVNSDRSIVIVFQDGCHERDSSNDLFLAYKRVI